MMNPEIPQRCGKVQEWAGGVGQHLPVKPEPEDPEDSFSICTPSSWVPVPSAVVPVSVCWVNDWRGGVVCP